MGTVCLNNNIHVVDSVKSKIPLTFWVLHLLSVELAEQELVRIDSVSVRHLLAERYGIQTSVNHANMALRRLAEIGLISREETRVMTTGKGGRRKAIFYIALQEDREKIIERMNSYVRKKGKREPSPIIKVLQRLDEILRLQKRTLELLERRIAKEVPAR